MATLELGPKSNLVVYELMPTRRRKAIPVQMASQHHEEPVALAFSADGKLLATLLPEVPSPAATSAAPVEPSIAGLNVPPPATSQSTAHAQNCYAITVYLWRTGKTLASISLGSPSLAAISPQVRVGSCLPLFFTVTLLAISLHVVVVVVWFFSVGCWALDQKRREMALT